MTKSFLCPFKDPAICKDIPLVDYKEAWHEGGTGYIDGIRPSDDIFTSGPLAKFIDNAGRSAIAIKYSVSCTIDFKVADWRDGEYAVAAFQRYTDPKSFWVYGGHYQHNGAVYIGAIKFESLERLIHDKHKKFHIAHEGDYVECSMVIEDSSVVATEHQPSDDNYHADM